MNVVWQVLYIVLMCYFGIVLLARLVMDWVLRLARDWQPANRALIVAARVHLHRHGPATGAPAAVHPAAASSGAWRSTCPSSY